ncbi:NYN domain-containing protein [Candidatus Parcubacteria bacterium]|nr:NYN domain-containing protein [Candidatus Parcubacteria bacterium]
MHYHLAIPDKSDNVFLGTKRFLAKIGRFVTLKKKPIKYTPIAGKVMKKADVDVEITIDVVRNVDDLDVVIVVSGDSDFVELKNYVVYDKKKGILFIGYEENMAWELRQCWHLYLNRIKNEVILRQKNKPRVLSRGSVAVPWSKGQGK